MIDIRISEDLWSNSMVQEGVLERWRLDSGQTAQAGVTVAEVRVEGALHEMPAPAAGRLIVLVAPGAVVEPGDVIGSIDAG